MHHDIPLISTTAMAFVLACVFGFAAHRLRLPPLVGYLLAGVVIGPFSPGFVADSALAGQLAEMGVILLMFGVGLHFSVGDLMAVRWIAVPGAIGQIAIATAMGARSGVGLGLEFSAQGSSSASAFRSRARSCCCGRSRSATLWHLATGRIAVGWLIVEDLVMVLTLVLLPASAGVLGGSPARRGRRHGGGSVLVNIGVTLLKVAAFIGLAVLLGPRVVPWLLKQAARAGSRELFTLSVLALALGIAYGSAEVFGVSFALGAFFAGVVLNESDFSHRAAADSLPLQDAFAILFFVSVGMLFDPAILVREPLAVLAVLLVIMVGKSRGRVGGRPGAGLSARDGADGVGQPGADRRVLLHSCRSRRRHRRSAARRSRPHPGRGAAVDHAQSSGLRSRRSPGGRRPVQPPRSAGGSAPMASRSSHVAAPRACRHGQAQARPSRAWSADPRSWSSDFPIFADLDHQGVGRSAAPLPPRSAAPGDESSVPAIVAEAAYFIDRGCGGGHGGRAADQAGPRRFFGEMALLTGRRRSADVTAVDYCRLSVLSQRDFRSLSAALSAAAAKLLEMAQQRAETNRERRAAEAAAAA